jgi:hypothetical protein
MTTKTIKEQANYASFSHAPEQYVPVGLNIKGNQEIRMVLVLKAEQVLKIRLRSDSGPLGRIRILISRNDPS